MISLHLYLFLYTFITSKFLLFVCSFRITTPDSIHVSNCCFVPLPYKVKCKRRFRSILFESSKHDHETLMHISIRSKNKIQQQDSLILWAQTFLRTFPFAAILPVQPLTYKLRDDDEHKGLCLVFLRKKTEEKGVVDGGIDFFIQDSSFLNKYNDDELIEENDSLNHKIDIIAKRNPEGQTVNKIFSEMLIIKAFVKSLVDDPAISVDSIFHKWM